MLSVFKRFAVASAFLMPGIACVTATSANAVLAAPHFVALKASTGHAGPAADLKGSGSTVTYSPRVIDAVVVSAASCSSTNYSFAIFNLTKSGQKVLYGKTVEFKIKPDKGVGVCAEATGNITFGLASSPKAKLKVTIS
ncbi:MAG: hypothetical protein WAM97_01645 [Acidimicrobiales bacterium]|jgi:hypothetical protein